MKKRIFIAHWSDIVRRGLMSLAEETANVPCEFIVETPTQPAVPDADVYILDSGAFMHHLDFFLKRKERVAVVCNLEAGSDVCSGVVCFGLAASSQEIKRALSELLERSEENSNPQTRVDLSNREIEVLREIGRGKSFKEIADTLFISVNTVTTHRKNISAKLGIRTVSGLSVYAHLNNLVPPD